MKKNSQTHQPMKDLFYAVERMKLRKTLNYLKLITVIMIILAFSLTIILFISDQDNNLGKLFMVITDSLAAHRSHCDLYQFFLVFYRFPL